MRVVHGASTAVFDALLERECAREGLSEARELDSASFGRIAEQSLAMASAQAGHMFPPEPMEQLMQAVEAVFRSWRSEKARHYRRLNGIPEEPGTAVMVQMMVFGNAGSESGAGVGFTRDPATGAKELYLDFLFNAQGEDVVAGRHTPDGTDELMQRLPKVATELRRLTETLEREFRDMQGGIPRSNRCGARAARGGARRGCAMACCFCATASGRVSPALTLLDRGH